MTSVLYGLTAYSLLVVVFQAVLVAVYCRWIRTTHFTESGYCPEVAVVLSIRGLDPSLEACLTGLAQQQYSGKYLVHVIVDHLDDQAHNSVAKLTSQLGASKFELHVGIQPSHKCSLKCDRLVQVIRRLPDSVEAICLIDADTIPDKKWLSSLVQPLVDPHVACSSGNRWFYPPAKASGNWGNITRYLWNSAAVVQMYVYGIAWGGSLALRRSAIFETQLLDRWASSLFDDVLLRDHFNSHGLTFVSNSALLIPNIEPTTMSGAIGWIKRQLLDAKLYHHKWPLVLLHSIGSSLLWLAILGLLIRSLTSGNLLIAGCAMALFASLVVANFLLLFGLEKSANKNINARRRWLGNSPVNWLTLGRVFEMLIGVLLVQIVFCYSAIWAASTKFVTWRRCRYRIKSKFEIEMINYAPYSESKRIEAANQYSGRSID